MGVCFWIGSFLITFLGLRWEGKLNCCNSVLHCLYSCALGTVCYCRMKDCKTGRKISGYFPGKNRQSVLETFWRKRNDDYRRRKEGAFVIAIERKRIIYLHAKRLLFNCVFKCGWNFLNIISVNPFKIWVFMKDGRRNDNFNK